MHTRTHTLQYSCAGRGEGVCEDSLFIDIQVEEDSVSAAALEISRTRSGSSYICHVILITETSEEQGSAAEELRRTGVQAYRGTGVQAYRRTGVQAYRVQGYRVQVYRCTGSSSVRVYHDCQKVAFKMYPGNGHATENGAHNRRDITGKMPDIVSKSQDQRYSMKEESVNRNSTWTMDSSSQAYSGPEDNSTDPHETLTETSTLTYIDAHIMEDSAESHSLHGMGMVYLKEFVLIDDDDDGDMSLREKTVTDLSVMDGKAADLVCGRLLSTSSSSLSECKEESP
ncbi:hypothetical protein INR49_016688, partial [Caranx melampygus]